jgi:hypothetical protein
MIKEFVEKWESNKVKVEQKFQQTHPENYEDVVKAVIEILGAGNDYDVPDPERIHAINDGDYQGTLLFVIGAKGYQPNDYWVVKVFYGSCSGCDTLQGIRDYEDDPPNPEQVKDYMALALHIVQGLEQI